MTGLELASRLGLPTESQVRERGKKQKLSEADRAVLRPMIAKHGVEDYAEMFRDLKLNVLQWGPGEIRRKLKVWVERGYE